MSFRKQIFIKPCDEEKINENPNMQITVTMNWIYLSREKIQCFVCHKEGHLAKSCPNTQSHQNTTNLIPPKENSENAEVQMKKDAGHFSLPTLKRINPAPSSSNNSSPVSDPEAQSGKQRRKRKKNSTPIEKPSISVFEEKLSPALDYISSIEEDTGMNVKKFATLFHETYGESPDQVKIAVGQHFNDPQDFIDILIEIYKHIQDRSLKVRITKLKKHLAPTQISDSEGSGSEEEETQ